MGTIHDVIAEMRMDARITTMVIQTVGVMSYIFKNTTEHSQAKQMVNIVYE